MTESELVGAIAQALAGATDWVWKEGDAVYSAGETAIFYGAIEAFPDRAVGITPYTIDDDIQTGLAVRRVQLRFRGSPRVKDDADNMAGEAFTVLQRLARTAGLSLVFRLSSAQLGADENVRQERTDNYQVILDNSEAF